LGRFWRKENGHSLWIRLLFDDLDRVGDGGDDGGIVEVALFAARTEGGPPLATIKSTLRPTRSAANAGSRS